MSKKVDIVVSFDTTGSMYPVISEVRQNVSEFVKDLFKSIPDLRIGVIAHGDYCDADNPYCIRIMDLTDDVNELCNFVDTTKRTCGGDADECYELVLNQARTEVSWRKDSTKALVMIGDASPHNVNYPMNKEHLDWEKEAQGLKGQGIKVYAVHALANYRRSSQKFYATVARVTNGVYLTLDNFGDVSKLIKATMLAEYDEEKLTEYVSVIRKSNRVSTSLSRNINRLTGIPDVSPGESVEFISKDGLVSVPAGRFQVMSVPENCVIRDFITSRGIDFKPGRGFYELTKSEKVQQYKEVILEDIATGELFTGAQVREYLGLKPQTVKGGATERLSSRDKLEGYRVFVQSTSYNRKLIGGTTFMYEVSDIDEDKVEPEHELASSGSASTHRAKADCKASSKNKRKVSKVDKGDIKAEPVILEAKLSPKEGMSTPEAKSNKKGSRKAPKTSTKGVGEGTSDKKVNLDDVKGVFVELPEYTAEKTDGIPEVVPSGSVNPTKLCDKVLSSAKIGASNKSYVINVELSSSEYDTLSELLKVWSREMEHVNSGLKLKGDKK